MGNQKRVLLIAHFCDYGTENSNNRFNYLADMLTKEGYEVELITSTFSHRDKKQRTRQATESDYIETLVYEPSYKKNISLKRLLVSHRVAAKNLKKYLESCQVPDIVYCAIPTIDFAQVAKEYAERWHLPFVIDVQDLWPEAYKLIIKNDFVYNLLTFSMKRKIDNIYAAADSIVAVSQTYANRAISVNEKCKDTTVVFLGTEKATFEKNAREQNPVLKKPEGEIWLAYCGTLGNSYDLSVVFDALEQLPEQQNKRIKLIIMGSGPLEEQFKSRAKAVKIPVEFTGKLPYETMCAQLCECDIALNPIAKGAAQSIINKHADYAMAALPVISTQENDEYKSLLSQYACGISCAPGDAAALAQAIKALAGDAPRRAAMREGAARMAHRRFERATAYQEILQAIEKVFQK